MIALRHQSSSFISEDRQQMTVRQTIFQIALLASLVTALTLVASRVYPTWDDGRLMLAISESGTNAIWTNFGNRPLAAYFYVFLLHRQRFLSVGIALHWMSWLGMGLVTMSFWRVMFPAHARFALLPALLSVSPILSKTQLIVLTIVTIDVIPTVFAFMAILLLLSGPLRGWPTILVDGAALALVVLSVLISEYAVVTAGVGLILLGANAITKTGNRRRERTITAILLAICVAISYSIFLWLTRDSGRDAFRPSYILTTFSFRIPFRLLSAIWRGVIGGVLESLGSITIHSKAAFLSFVCGAVFASLVVIVMNRKEEFEPVRKQDWVSFVSLVAALVVALIPVVLMDRTLESKWDSRFWIPVLPLACTLSVYILFCLLRTRLYLIVPVLCGFLAAYRTTSEIVSALQNPDSLTSIRKINTRRSSGARLEALSSARLGEKKCSRS